MPATEKDDNAVGSAPVRATVDRRYLSTAFGNAYTAVRAIHSADSTNVRILRDVEMRLHLTPDLTPTFTHLSTQPSFRLIECL